VATFELGYDASSFADDPFKRDCQRAAASMRLILTGGAGFIGSAAVREAIARGHHVLNVDVLTYAGDPARLADVSAHPRYAFEKADVADGPKIASLVSDYTPDAILHLAAESHVDRSIDGPGSFVHTNVLGTYALLEATRRYWSKLNARQQSAFRFIQVSTDEVYGSLGAEGHFVENTPYAPNSPYSASKAAGDHFARAWFRTYDLPVIITNCSNNYGPYQHPEKFIPTVIYNVLAGTPVPIYGRGTNRRDWIFVGDHVAGILAALARGRPGETYNFGSRSELSNLELAQAVCRLIDARRPRADGRSSVEQIEFVADRPGHDFRYATDPAKAEAELGWGARTGLDEGLGATVDWYLSHSEWLGSKADGLARFGLYRARRREIAR
jgi:dTDP-glucose 4,6-dehydratase